MVFATHFICLLMPFVNLYVVIFKLLKSVLAHVHTRFGSMDTAVKLEPDSDKKPKSEPIEPGALQELVNKRWEAICDESHPQVWLEGLDLRGLVDVKALASYRREHHAIPYNKL
jgi:hypothetical protein